MVYGNGRGGEGEWAFRICPSNDAVDSLEGRPGPHSGREREREREKAIKSEMQCRRSVGTAPLTGGDGWVGSGWGRKEGNMRNGTDRGRHRGEGCSKKDLCNCMIMGACQ